jgi:hypothetical protein
MHNSERKIIGYGMAEERRGLYKALKVSLFYGWMQHGGWSVIIHPKSSQRDSSATRIVTKRLPLTENSSQRSVAPSQLGSRWSSSSSPAGTKHKNAICGTPLALRETLIQKESEQTNRESDCPATPLRKRLFDVLSSPGGPPAIDEDGLPRDKGRCV